jgi:hypothetical protein
MKGYSTLTSVCLQTIRTGGIEISDTVWLGSPTACGGFLASWPPSCGPGCPPRDAPDCAPSGPTACRRVLLSSPSLHMILLSANRVNHASWANQFTRKDHELCLREFLIEVRNKAAPISLSENFCEIHV